MKYLKNFLLYKESLKIDLGIIKIDMNESLGLYYENVLKSIGATELNIYDTFNLQKDDFIKNIDIEQLADNNIFISSLAKNGLKKSQVQNTNDYECFIKPSRFMMLFNTESNELENPVYILFQAFNEKTNKWEDAKLFKVNGDIKSFYDKISSKIIEVFYDEEKYIYSTSNGNEWVLQNLEKENDIFKKYFRKKDFEDLIQSKKATINII